MNGSGEPAYDPAMVRHDPMRRRDVLAGGVAALTAGACSAAGSARISLLDYLPPAEHQRIAAGTSDLDVAPLIARALRDSIAAHSVLWLPRGLYTVLPAIPLIHADHFECLAAIRILSGMRIAGEAGTTLRVAAGYSTDARPRAGVMFGADASVADVELSGLTLDMNGRANPISPDRAAGHYARYPQAQIFVSSRDGAPAARIDRARIADVSFRDANGVSCIVMAQNSDPAALLGRGWTIDRCRFEENGHDTDDHSSIFAWAEEVAINSCRFVNARPFDGTGVNTAIEVHGARQRITRSTFVNMMRGIWVANNFSAPTVDTLVADNDFRPVFYGVDFFHDRPSAREVVDTRIERNRFAFDDTAIARLSRLDLKAAVQIASEYAQRKIAVTGNVATKKGHAITAAFVVVTGGASGDRRHDAISVTGNIGDGLTFGSFLRTAPGAGLGSITLTGNRWTGLAPSRTMAIAAGDAVEQTGHPQPIETLTLGGGTAEPATRGDRRFRPVFINTLVRSLVIKPVDGYGSGGVPVVLGGAARVLRTERPAS
ncbi:hypothetical protein COA17_09425 [Sphingomonas ginsenosidimutans]|jgi:hypothetical protein|uniref:Pectate lyase superfamily protein domain-containing protein n=2 Tax=Sphingomonas ginsenosidimutans TaxID=862134 RepID=A0A2A4HW44_9SPHN|nr:hypothetical protein COA17_09425 [Sphingomonas ginsenosidimutans]